VEADQLTAGDETENIVSELLHGDHQGAHAHAQVQQFQNYLAVLPGRGLPPCIQVP
jgi:hypothetical protein